MCLILSLVRGRDVRRPKKQFAEFTRALHIFKLLCQSNDTVD